MQGTGSEQFWLKDSLNLPVSAPPLYLPLFVSGRSLLGWQICLENRRVFTSRVAQAKFLPLIRGFYAE